MDENNTNEKDALEQFISEQTSSKKQEYKLPTKTSTYKGPLTDMDFFSVDLNMLPAGMFYKPGTQIKIKAATTADIQAYSGVDDRNFLDVTDKMNHILSTNIRVVFPGGQLGSYKDIKDNDRLFLIFMIRELTFQKNTNLAKDIECSNCNYEFKIQFRATPGGDTQPTFSNYEMPEDLVPFFNEVDRCFDFNLADFDILNGSRDVWKLAPPSIGMQEIFFKDIRDKVQNEKNPNVSFLKIMPFILWDRSSITEDGIKEWEKKFKQMDKEEFSFLDHAVNKMVFGIKELKTTCTSCGTEVHTDMSFPEGASSIFALPDPFAKFKEKRI